MNAEIAVLQQVGGPPRPASDKNRVAEEDAVTLWLEEGMINARQVLSSTTALGPGSLWAGTASLVVPPLHFNGAPPNSQQ